MSSSRIVLLFLAIILLVVIILSSGRIANFLRSKAGNVLPSRFAGIVATPTPTPGVKIEPSPTSTQESASSGQTKGGMPTSSSSTNSEIPATGVEDIAWVLMGGAGSAGYILRKLSTKRG